MKDRILKGWNGRRLMYVGMGVFIVVQALLTKQYAASLFGVYFASMGIFNFGCASGVCAYAPPPRTKVTEKKDDEETTFQKV